MLDWLSTDPFFQLLWLVVLIELMLLLPQLIWLWLRSIRAARRREATAEFEAAVGVRLLGSLHEPQARQDWVRDASRYPEEVVRGFLSPYLLTTTGDMHAALAEVYAELGFLEEDLEGLRAPTWQRRMYAVRNLAPVAEPAHREAIVRLSNDRQEIRMMAAQVLARAGTAGDVADVLFEWKSTTRLAERPIRSLVSNLPTEHLEALMEQWLEFPDPAVRRILLTLAASRAPGAAARWIDLASKDPNIEVRIAACDALATLRLPGAVGRLVELTAAEEWQVRARAVRSLGRMAPREGVDLITRLMRDRAFWVRRNAAGALAGLGPQGIAALRDAAVSDPDRFARDGAREELMRIGLADGAVGRGV